VCSCTVHNFGKCCDLKKHSAVVEQFKNIGFVPCFDEVCHQILVIDSTVWDGPQIV